ANHGWNRTRMVSSGPGCTLYWSTANAPAYRSKSRASSPLPPPLVPPPVSRASGALPPSSRFSIGPNPLGEQSFADAVTFAVAGDQRDVAVYAFVVCFSTPATLHVPHRCLAQRLGAVAPVPHAAKGDAVLVCDVCRHRLLQRRVGA